MAKAKKIPVKEYKVQLTLTRAEARLVHKLVGCIPTTSSFVNSTYRELERVLGSWGDEPCSISEFPDTLTDEFINAGYQED